MALRLITLIFAVLSFTASCTGMYAKEAYLFKTNTFVEQLKNDNFPFNEQTIKDFLNNKINFFDFSSGENQSLRGFLTNIKLNIQNVTGSLNRYQYTDISIYTPPICDDPNYHLKAVIGVLRDLLIKKKDLSNGDTFSDILIIFDPKIGEYSFHKITSVGENATVSSEAKLQEENDMIEEYSPFLVALACIALGSVMYNPL